MNKKVIVKRYIMLLVGIIVLAIGNVFPVLANLGVAPISAPPYVFSLITGMTIGKMIIIINALYIVLQILLLKKDFKWMQLLQLVVGIVFGYTIDLFMIVFSNLNCSTYLYRLIWCVLGTIIIGIGVTIEIKSNTIALPGDKLVEVVSKVKNWEYGKTKIGFDILLVLISFIASLIFLGKIEGLREGTIIGAILTGYVIKLIDKPIDKFVKKYIER